MTHIIITAGGTTEAIDGVRQIINTSTGRLSACIYEALADFAGTGAEGLQNQAFTVHYVVSASAVRPETKKSLPIIFYPVTDVKSVEAVLKELMAAHPIGYVVHGMAVSDFTKGYLIEREQLAGELAGTLEEAFKGRDKDWSFEELRTIVSRVIEKPTHALDPEAKVSSRSELILSLVKTPKLIELFKSWSPGAFLVGFKLLKGVSEEELIRVGADLAAKNGCNLVLANDLAQISGDRHPGLLLQNGRVVGRYDTKAAIARGIVEHMFMGGEQNQATADREMIR